MANIKQNKYLGKMGLVELVNLIYADFQSKQDWLQFTEMPSAPDYVGKVVQYTGTTNDDFTKGYFYYSDGVSWALVNVKATLRKYADSDHYDPDAEYDSIGEDLVLNGLEIESLTDDEIKDLFEEV